MAYKRLAGDRLIGTEAEREAIIVETKSQDYAGILSTYDPYFFLKFDEGTGTSLTNSGSGSETAAINLSASNPSWVAGYDGYALDWNSSKSYSDSNQGAPNVAISGSIDGGNEEVWSVMVLIKFIGSIPDNMIMGYRGDQYNNIMGVGSEMGATAMKFHSSSHSGQWYHAESNTDLTPDVWCTLGITNTSSGLHSFYLNGVADGSADIAGSATQVFNGLTIRADGGTTDNWLVDCVFYDDSTVSSSNMAGISAKMRTSSYAYPNMVNGTIFEETDTGKHYMWNGTNAWNEMI